MHSVALTWQNKNVNLGFRNIVKSQQSTETANLNRGNQSQKEKSLIWELLKVTVLQQIHYVLWTL